MKDEKLTRLNYSVYGFIPHPSSLKIYGSQGYFLNSGTRFCT